MRRSRRRPAAPAVARPSPDRYGYDEGARGELPRAPSATGQAGMAPTGTWNFENVGPYFPPNHAEAGFAPFPSDPSVGGPVYALGIGTSLSISATSQNAVYC